MIFKSIRLLIATLLIGFIGVASATDFQNFNVAQSCGCGGQVTQSQSTS